MSTLTPGRSLKNYKPILVKPRRYPLDGCGCIWEYELEKLGWNNLPADKRFGEIVAGFYADWLDVYFPALDLTVSLIASDEVVAYVPEMEVAGCTT